jgi:hypothetical protein
LRAIKTTLLAAGALKLAQENARTENVGNEDKDEVEERQQSAEARLIVRALLDCNIPKLLADDIFLFRGKAHSPPIPSPPHPKIVRVV